MITSEDDALLAAHSIGWWIQNLLHENIAKIIAEKKAGRIIQTRDHRRLWAMNFPALSVSEERLIKQVLELFWSKEEQKKKIDPFESLNGFFKQYCEEGQLDLESDQAEYLLFVLHRMAFGFWPLDCFLDESGIEEIAVTGIGDRKPVRVFDQDFGWLDTNLFFSSADFFKDLVNRMGRPVGRRLSFKSPRINARLNDGSRLHAAIEPVAFFGPCATIRKFREKPFSPSDLVQLNTVSAEIMAFLGLAMETDCSILMCGNTGSGKTSTLNALFLFVPSGERVISVEETPELQLPQPHWICLTTSEEADISMQSLICDSLRMRPDRIVVGEIRSEVEVKAFWDTLLAGQGKGSYATFHAQSGTEALARLTAMAIPRMDLASLDLIVVQKRVTLVDSNENSRSEVRRITEVSEVAWTQNGPRLRTLFEFDFVQKKWIAAEESERVFEKIQNTFGFDRARFLEELDRRSIGLENKIQLEGLKK